MKEHTKQVLENPELLREKLKIFLQTDYAVGSYARACEKFYQDGEFAYRATWSWGAFFFGFLFYVFRCRIGIGYFTLLFSSVVGAIVVNGTNNIVAASLICFAYSVWSIWLWVYAKFSVCSHFVDCLEQARESEVDCVLEKEGGYSFLLVFLYLFLGILFQGFYMAIIN
ncbi:hypothetical protein [Campylobacter sp. 19-13652]|uniref:hypothetical protein n=1 Tax=Campylobacter sp. 19-13652 TaxID=2840180 RepID=UPI001C795659|nr:hypothetical protein [Campylobacter sp. 19-13652]BCX80253.1 hypothetical protein LBC_17150 [Campylobacter sp. 19-13652]